MFMTSRMVQAAPGKVGDLIEAATKATQLLNAKVGSDYGVAIQVGGNPDVIGASYAWETMAAYQAARDAYMADEAIMNAMAAAGALSVSTTDMLFQILTPPGDRKPIVGVNMALMHMPRVAEAIPFGLEVCELVESKVGITVGFAAAMTGNRAQVGWMAYYDSLDQFATLEQQLESDPEYLDLFKRADDLYVDGSLEQTLWHRLT